MEKFVSVTSKTIAVPANDIDTDQIIPAQFLTSIDRDGYGENLFARLKQNDPDFPFNQKQYQGATILITGSNFGCGSSREHAVWALTDAGIKVVIAASFADIFYNNSAKNGLLLVVLPEAAISELIKDRDNQVTVDLEGQTVETAGGAVHHFDYDPFRKHCLLNGLDDIDYILTYKNETEKHKEDSRENWMKSTTSKRS
ncbi:MAG: 3-isopropylmalate dehydratase small subunit [Candidatus Obscuribacterales bacterium]|nr:3-isopropylmalate dehydratase small subunit [Candidatus Obscuribacterales bacterium]